MALRRCGPLQDCSIAGLTPALRSPRASGGNAGIRRCRAATGEGPGSASRGDRECEYAITHNQHEPLIKCVDDFARNAIEFRRSNHLGRESGIEKDALPVFLERIPLGKNLAINPFPIRVARFYEIRPVRIHRIRQVEIGS